MSTIDTLLIKTWILSFQDFSYFATHAHMHRYSSYISYRKIESYATYTFVLFNTILELYLFFGWYILDLPHLNDYEILHKGLNTIQ